MIADELRTKCDWCEPCDACVVLMEKAAQEIERLEAIVDRLPKTDDGVPVAFDRELWYVANHNEIVRLKHSRDLPYWDLVEACYSTREAAEAAMSTGHA